ncbi:sulfotransferase 1A1-like [Homarus americanus]|uniref:sulfotransferase 1A1-like n=1 Tax=Homarus americanus TaxID=6706 RepID=UPI001C47A08A|nr:sulfotransferase 1A1-like [Homarus americanus]
MDNKMAVERVTMKTVSDPRTEDLSLYSSEYLEVNPGRVFLPSFYADWHDRYTNFTVHHEDVWVVTFPKSGTTWTQELVWCLMKDKDSPEAQLELMKRFPFFEYDCLIHPDMEVSGLKEDDPMRPGLSWKMVQSMAAPRTIKSHLPMQLLPRQIWDVKPKVVYVCRDPRDVCISYYYHYRKLEGYVGDLQHFIDCFLDEKVVYSPIWSHILTFWQLRHQHHVLFIRFEDMKEDLAAVVRQVAEFLGKEVKEEEVSWLVHHCSFDQMSQNPAANNETFTTAPTEEAKGIKFMRTGQVGDWKNYLTEEQQKAFKTWTLKNLEGSDFPYYQDFN